MRYILCEVLENSGDSVLGNFAFMEENPAAKFTTMGGNYKDEDAERRAIRAAILNYYKDAPGVARISTNSDASRIVFYYENGGGLVYIDDESVLFFYTDNAIKNRALELFRIYR